MKIQSGGTVKVISGADRGHVGKVVSVDHDKRKVMIEGVNMVYKHVKPSRGQACGCTSDGCGIEDPGNRRFRNR